MLPRTGHLLRVRLQMVYSTSLNTPLTYGSSLELELFCSDSISLPFFKSHHRRWKVYKSIAPPEWDIDPNTTRGAEKHFVHKGGEKSGGGPSLLLVKLTKRRHGHRVQ